MSKIADIVKLKTGYANFVDLKSAFEAASAKRNRTCCPTIFPYYADCVAG